jgi:spermidine synthase
LLLIPSSVLVRAPTLSTTLAGRYDWRAHRHGSTGPTGTEVATAALVEAPERILILGLGGGTLARLVEKAFPNAKVEAVEIDPGVFWMARTFLSYTPSKNTQVVLRDARAVVQERRGNTRYDLVFVDCFGSDHIPPHLLRPEFLGELAEILTDQGVLATNLWPGHASYPTTVALYRQRFAKVWIMRGRASRNHVLVAARADRTRDWKRALERARQVGRKVSPSLALDRELAKLQR